MTALRPAHELAGARNRALTIRQAADATGVNPRTIRRRLAQGVFPGAYKDVDFDQPDTLVWRIPVDDLQAAGFALRFWNDPTPTDLDLTTIEAAETAATLIGTDRFARLRSELAEAVAAAELALLRAEADKWRAVAEERAHALTRADRALSALSSFKPTEARATAATSTSEPVSAPERPTTNLEAVLFADSAGFRGPTDRRAAKRGVWRRRGRNR